MNRKFKRTVLISNETLLEQCKRLYCCFFLKLIVYIKLIFSHTKFVQRITFVMLYLNNET